MELISETLEIRGATFTVEETTFDTMMPLVEKLSEGGPDGQAALMAACVKMNGEPLTVKDVKALPMTVARELLPAVMRVNGMEPVEGNV